MGTATLNDLQRRPTEVEEQNYRVDMFSANGFRLAQRLAQAYMTSNAVPAIFRSAINKREKRGNDYVDVEIDNPSALGNCLVAIETAMSVGMSITAVMQNANIIEGKLTWSGKFVIASINASRRFSPLRFKIENKGRISAKYKEKGAWNNQKRGFDFTEVAVEVENIVCTAWAYVIRNSQETDEKIEGVPVSIKMAVEEGWYSKPGSKWQGEMKHLMLQYRAGSFFGNIHAPDIVMGMGRTTEEAEDILDVVQQSDGSYAVPVGDLNKGAADPAKEEARASKQASAETVEPNSETVVERKPEPTPAATTAAEPTVKAEPVQVEATKAEPAKPDNAGPTHDEILAMSLSAVKSGNIDEARDLQRKLPDSLQREVADAIDDYLMAQQQETVAAQQTTTTKRLPARRAQGQFSDV